MNIINYKKTAIEAVKNNEPVGLFNGATKKATKRTIKYTYNNYVFFKENHTYFGAVRKKTFQLYYKSLTNGQRKELWLLFYNLTNGIEMFISEVKFDENSISYVDVKTTYRKKEVKFKLFYFFGLHKLLSFSTNCKYNLDLKTILEIANQK